MSGPAIIHDARAAWLMRRRELITASDVAAILCVDPYRRASDVYLEKTGQGEVAESEPMRWGKRMEDAIAAGYVAVTRRRVHAELPYEITSHPDLPWLGATLDRGVSCDGYSADFPAVPAPPGATGLGALELKATADATMWEDEPPTAYQIQLLIQMACSRRNWGSLTAFVSLYRPVVVVDQTFDADLFALIVPRLEEFRGYVQRREPPTEFPSWFSRSAIRQLWPADSGESIVLEPPQHALALVAEWEKYREAESEARASKEFCEDKLRLLMQDATVGYLQDGSSLTLKTVKESPVPAHTRAAYRMLRRFWPKGLSRRKE